MRDFIDEYVYPDAQVRVFYSLVLVSNERFLG